MPEFNINWNECARILYMDENMYFHMVSYGRPFPVVPLNTFL